MYRDDKIFKSHCLQVLSTRMTKSLESHSSQAKDSCGRGSSYRKTNIKKCYFLLQLWPCGTGSLSLSSPTMPQLLKLSPKFGLESWLMGELPKVVVYATVKPIFNNPFVLIMSDLTDNVTWKESRRKNPDLINRGKQIQLLDFIGCVYFGSK